MVRSLVMTTKERFDILSKHIRETHEDFLLKIQTVNDIKELDALTIKFNNLILLHRNSYSEDIQKIFQQQRIEKLNGQEFLTLEDCKSLVIGGSDELSSLGSKQLWDLMQSNLGPLNASGAMDMLTEAFGGAIAQKSRAMRWIIRGLSIDHAIAKIHYDSKMYAN